MNKIINDLFNENSFVIFLANKFDYRLTCNKFYFIN